MIAAIPAILGVISGVASLLEVGSDVAEKITGKRPDPTKESMEEALGNMTEEQQQMWVAEVQPSVDVYKAETERLAVQGGKLDPETLSQFSQETADYIGVLRMTTRPLVTRRMAHVLLLPVYVVAFDMLATLLNYILTISGASVDPVPLLAATFFESGSLYFSLYEAAAVPAAGIVIAYMTLREMGKAGGPKKATESVSDTIGGAVRAAARIFRR